jgi:hypothetical protein
MRRKRGGGVVAFLCWIALPSAAALAGDNPWRWLVDKGGPVWSASTAEAKRRGVLIAPLTAEPGALKVAGQELKVREAWIEKRFQVVYKKGGGGRKKVEDGYNLVFIVAGKTEVLLEKGTAFHSEDGGKSFTYGFLDDGAMLNVERLEKEDVSDVRVVLSFKDKSERPLVLRFKRQAEQRKPAPEPPTPPDQPRD